MSLRPMPPIWVVSLDARSTGAFISSQLKLRFANSRRPDLLHNAERQAPSVADARGTGHDRMVSISGGTQLPAVSPAAQS